MSAPRSSLLSLPTAERSLDVFLLPLAPWAAVRRLQDALAEQLAGSDREHAALLLGEHRPAITVGRAGSARDVLMEEADRRAREVETRWVARGGGAWSHQPGMLCLYAVVPLGAWGLTVARYRDVVRDAVAGVFEDFLLPAEFDAPTATFSIHGRQAAMLGFAVRRGVATFGAAVNVANAEGRRPAVRHLGDVRATTLLRERQERRTTVTVGAVKLRLADRFAQSLGAERTYFRESPFRFVADPNESPERARVPNARSA